MTVVVTAFGVAAQTPLTGTIRGVAKDVDGGVIPGATVIATCTPAGLPPSQANTNGRGEFTLVVPTGDCAVEASLPGFIPARTKLAVERGFLIEWNPVFRLAGATNRVPKGRDPSDPALVREVYAAVLEHVALRNRVSVDRINVLNISAAPYWLSDAEWRDTFAGISEIRQEWESEEALTPVWVERTSLPSGVSLVSRTDSRMPKLAITRVFASKDKRHALVYFAYTCGNLCGEGTLLWLAPLPNSPRWGVRAKLPKWVS